MNTLHLWNLKGKVDPAFTKEVPQPGGRTMTAIDTYYKIREATEIFGPMGIGWGIEIKNMQFVPCKVWRNKDHVDGVMAVIHCTFWYYLTPELREGLIGQPGVSAVRCEFDMFNNISLDSNEDACKSLLTDTVTKALSYLGFGHEIFMGMMDGNRYVIEKATKVDENAKQNFLNVVARCESLGYNPEKIAKLRDYHERQGYVLESVTADQVKLERWLNTKLTQELG